MKVLQNTLGFLALAVLLLVAGSSRAQLGNLARPVAFVRGDIVSSDGVSLPGISVTILRGTERVTTTKSAPDGKFTMILNPDATFRIIVNDGQYAYHEDTLVVPALAKYQEYPVHVVLTRLHDGQTFEIDNPVFMPNSSTIEPASMVKLDGISDLLRHNMKLSVNVTVYPDGPVTSKKDAAQQRLVEMRGTALRSYFLGKGIQAARFSVATATSVPPGKFNIPGVSPTPVQDPEPPAKGKKKAPAPAAPKPGLIPQYVEIVAHLAS